MTFPQWYHIAALLVSKSGESEIVITQADCEKLNTSCNGEPPVLLVTTMPDGAQHLQIIAQSLANEIMNRVVH